MLSLELNEVDWLRGQNNVLVHSFLYENRFDKNVEAEI